MPSYTYSSILSDMWCMSSDCLQRVSDSTKKSSNRSQYYSKLRFILHSIRELFYSDGNGLDLECLDTDNYKAGYLLIIWITREWHIECSSDCVPCLYRHFNISLIFSAYQQTNWSWNFSLIWLIFKLLWSTQERTSTARCYSVWVTMETRRSLRSTYSRPTSCQDWTHQVTGLACTVYTMPACFSPPTVLAPLPVYRTQWSICWVDSHTSMALWTHTL